MDNQLTVGQRIDVYRVLQFEDSYEGHLTVGTIRPAFGRQSGSLIDVLDDKGEKSTLVLVPFRRYPKQCEKVGTFIVKKVKEVKP